MEATSASFMLMEDRYMLNLLTNVVSMEFDAEVLKRLIDFDWWYLH